MLSFLKNRWFKFGFWAVLYTLWVIWLGSWWWLLGLIVVFDLYITRKVKWAFWKKEYKEGEKHNAWLDWLDALIFAVIVVTFINIFFIQSYKIPTPSMEKTLKVGDHLFVSKLAYGPKLPERPLSMPFVHNMIFGRKSYSDLICKPYRRLAGFRDVRREDIVVFNFPDGDTVLSQIPSEDYYWACRYLGRKKAVEAYGPIIVRPNDKKEHYVKRCVAVAGDTLEVVDGRVVVNGIPEKKHKGIQLTQALDTYPADEPEGRLFPYVDMGWTRDYYGPVYVPAKGASVKLDESNLPLYSRIISVYEGHSLEVRDGKIVIDGTETDCYTFAQDYYWMMGDNRHNSLDSRYWGFVPEDHIVGTPVFVWLAKDLRRSFHTVRSLDK
ncbi:MAG: signal peptidase I [Bacteroidales bacterium]|nr:signal peptidase I [Bacteroidales bacterium]